MGLHLTESSVTGLSNAFAGQIADVPASNGKAKGLRSFWSAAADRDNNPVRVMFLGDSVTEGQGATTHTKRSQSRLATSLRRRFPTSGVPNAAGGNYIPAFYASPTIAASNPWVITGSPVTASNFGIGSRYVRLTSAAPGPLTLTVQGTSVDLLWAAGSAGAKFSYAIDGGSAVVVDTGAGSPLTDGNKTNVVLGSTPASHTIVVQWNAGGTVNFEGAVVYNGNETKGWQFYDAAHSGFDSAAFSSGNGATALAGVVPNVVKPHLIVVNLGLNDQNTAVTPATFQTNLTTIVTNLLGYMTGAGLHKPSILLVANYPSNGSYTYPWSQYVAAIKAVAAANPNDTFFFDLGPRFADQAADSTLAMTYDTTHPSDKGHAFIADLFTDLLAYGTLPLNPVDGDLVTTKGDLLVGSAAGILTRLAPGTDAYQLLADSTQPGGVKWAAPGAVPATGRALGASTTFLHAPGVVLGTITATAFGGGNIYYEPRYTPTAITIDQIAVETTILSSVAGAVIRLGIYLADVNWQPTTLVVDAGTVVAGSADSIGVKTITLGSPVTVTGRFLVARWQSAGGSMTLRVYRGGSNLLGITPSMGASPYPQQIAKTVAFSTYPGSPAAWDTPSYGSADFQNAVMVRVSSP